MNFSLTALDIIVVAIYFAAVMLIGWRISLNTDTGEDLLLGGRSIGWKAIGLSLFSTNISSTSLIGLAGFAYSSGIAVANYEWMACLILIFMTLFIIPVYLRLKVSTIPEYLKLRFGVLPQKYYSAITILLCIFLDTAGGIYAGVLVLNSFFPSLNMWYCSLGLALLAGLYTGFGGLKAVMYTDILQALVLILGSSLITFYVFQAINFQWSDVSALLEDPRFSLIRPIDDPELPWLGTLIGLPILGFWFWGTNQFSMQRLLGAKNIKQARRGALFGAFLKLLPLFIMVIPAALVTKVIPDLSNPDMVFPYMVGNLLPSGVVGLVIAGLVAAIMSSLDSALNSASTLVVHDFLQSDEKPLSQAQIKHYGRLSTFIIMAVAALWAPVIAHMGGIFVYFQQAFSILAPSIVAVYIMGIFTHKGSSKTAMKTMLVGHLIALLLFLAVLFNFFYIHYTILAGINFLISVGLLYVFSALENTQFSKFDTIYHYQDSFPVRQQIWCMDFRFFSLTLLVILAFIITIFW